MKNLIVLILSSLIFSKALNAQTVNRKFKISQFSCQKLDSIVQKLNDKGSINEAIPYAEKLNQKAKVELDKNDSLYLKSFYNLGFLYKKTNDYEKAKLYYRYAVKIAQESYGSSSYKCAKYLNSLAFIYSELDNHDKAKNIYIDLLKIEEETLINVSSFNNSDKLSFYETYTETLNNYGIFYIGKDDKKAEFLLKKAIRIKKDVFGKRHKSYWTTTANLVMLYMHTSNFESALKLQKDVLEAVKSISGEKHYKYGEELSRMAGILYYMDSIQGKKIENLLETALKIIEERVGKENETYTSALDVLSHTYSKKGNFKRAENGLIEIIKLKKKIFKEETLSYARSLHNLGIFYINQNQKDKGFSFLLKAISIEKRLFNSDPSQYAHSLKNLSELYKQYDELDLAYAYCMESIAVNSTNFKSIFPIFPDTTKQYSLDMFLSTFYELDYKKLGKLKYHRVETMKFSFNLLLNIIYKIYTKSKEKKLLNIMYNISYGTLILNESIKKDIKADNDKLRSFNTNKRYIYFGLKTIKKLYEDSIISDVSDAFVFMEQNKSILLIESLKKDQKISKAKIELNLRTVSHVQEIQELLDTNSIFLEYFISRSTTYLFSISKEGYDFSTLDIGEKKISEMVDSLRNTLVNFKTIDNPKKVYEDFTQQSYLFYKKILAPILENKKNVKHLIIVPDNKLNYIPFEIFLTKKAPKNIFPYNDTTQLRYLLCDYTVSYNYSASSWIMNKKSPVKKNNGRLLAFAASYNPKAPLLSYRSKMEKKLRKELSPLPAVIEEVSQLKELITEGDYFYGHSATEANFKQHATGYSILHLAMHGILDPKQPFISSLVFTESPDSLENNFLDEYEISNLKLNSDLIVLSACETGYGKFQEGEGVLSLARSFMSAGAPSLVVSLWKVNDVSTANIMSKFYVNLSNGLDKPTALQKAKLDFLTDPNVKFEQLHPFFWAPFIQLGDNKKITLKEKPGHSGLIAIILGLLVLAFFVFFLAKKNSLYKKSI